MRAWLTVGILVGALIVPAVAQAEPHGPAYRFSSGDARDSALASTERGRVLALWNSAASARVLGLSGPLAARVDLDSGYPFAGVVAANPRLGRYLRVWSEWTAEPDRGPMIVAQILTRSGVPETARRVVHYPEQDTGSAPVAATWNPRTRQFLVVFSGGGDRPAHYEGRLLDEGGEPVGEEFVVVDTDVGGYVGAPAVAVRPSDGTYVVVWHQSPFDSSDGTPVSIRGRRLGVAGTPIGSPFLVSDHSNLVGKVQNVDPRIAVDPASNEALVVWSDQYEVFARRIGSSGLPVGRDLWLSRMGPPSDPAWLTRSADVAFSPAARQYLVVWQSGPGSDPYPIGERIYGQHVDRAGVQIGANDFLVSTSDRAERPRVAAISGGSDFLVAWGDPFGMARGITATTQGSPSAPPESNPVPDRPPVAEPILPSQPPSPPTQPPPALEPGPPPAPVEVRVKGPRRLESFARRGLRIEVGCARGCRVRARVHVSKRLARSLGRRSPTLARRSVRVSPNALRTVTLRPSRRVARALLRRTRVVTRLRVETIDPDGVVRRIDRRLTLTS